MSLRTELATPEDIASSLAQLADALIRLKNYDEAESLLLGGLEAFPLRSRPDGALGCASGLAELYFRKGDWERARVHAEKLIEGSLAVGSVVHEAHGRLQAGRVCLAQGDSAAAKHQLSASLELAQRAAETTLEARASLYLAEALASTLAIKGREYLNRAMELLSNYRDATLDQDLKRISDRYRGERITLTGDNKLVINGHLLPTWNAAKEAVERFLLKNALEQSQDNQTKAGQILGITKVHVHDKRKQYGL